VQQVKTLKAIQLVIIIQCYFILKSCAEKG